ncbi:MAG: YqaE/Pmp3 family rane protein [Bacteroidetes bacterium]|nr:YqaE/Pmp3 family rane protein [Bacteroidota bacterium]
MRYFLCILLPPIAVLTTGKIGAFILSLLLTILGWIPGVIYAILITNKYYAERRHKELLEAARGNDL